MTDEKTLTEEVSNQPSNKKSLKEKWKLLSKKKKGLLISIVALVLVVAIALPIILNVVDRNKSKSYMIKSFNEFVISNFENYSAIAAGIIDTTGASMMSDGHKDKHDDNDDVKLVGIKKDGGREEIKFLDKHGKEHEQNYRLLHCDQHKNFTIFSMTNNPDKKYLDFENYQYSFYCYGKSDNNSYMVNLSNGKTGNDNVIEYTESYRTLFYIKDNNSNKIYDFSSILKQVCNEYPNQNIGLNILNIGNSSDVYEYDYLLLNFYENKPMGWNTIYTLSFEENSLKLTERISATQYKNFIHTADNSILKIYGDKYGNIFHNTDTMQDFSFSYQKTDGSFDSIICNKENNLDAFEACYSPNGILYVYSIVNNKTYYLNKNGELEEVELNQKLINLFINFNMINYETHYEYLSQTNNTYHFVGHTVSMTEPYFTHGYYKMTLDETTDWKYKLDYVEFDDSSTFYDKGYTDTSVANDDKFAYVLTPTDSTKINMSLVKYDLETGVSVKVDSKYRFKELKYNYKLSKITFKAVDTSTMNECYGYFDENYDIVIGDFRNNYKGFKNIYTIKPIN